MGLDGSKFELPAEFTHPAFVGLYVTVGAVVLLFLLSNVRLSARLRRAFGSTGTKMVQEDLSSAPVRR